MSRDPRKHLDNNSNYLWPSLFSFYSANCKPLEKKVNGIRMPRFGATSSDPSPPAGPTKRKVWLASHTCPSVFDGSDFQSEKEREPPMTLETMMLDAERRQNQFEQQQNATLVNIDSRLRWSIFVVIVERGRFCHIRVAQWTREIPENILQRIQKGLLFLSKTVIEFVFVSRSSMPRISSLKFLMLVIRWAVAVLKSKKPCSPRARIKNWFFYWIKSISSLAIISINGSNICAMNFPQLLSERRRRLNAIDWYVRSAFDRSRTDSSFRVTWMFHWRIVMNRCWDRRRNVSEQRLWWSFYRIIVETTRLKLAWLLGWSVSVYSFPIGLLGSVISCAGYPNVGKSSVINSLKRSQACETGATPGLTK